ncbi:phosphoglycolate phosphatase 1A, chloroplastic-like [Homalodisca vitripennis]|uniref:phosphoglycolate phosphatase 1A, chloroplastic-like n=1 Tax=Homalodisca vitripennis TaxID=197043 RepID=UPI001EE9D4EE|nr:phosphoglycolate phosphatase 1A, chloroplastic-like [Homalodisca vitripennis]
MKLIAGSQISSVINYLTKREMALKALSSLSSNEYETFLNSFDTVLSDCDGVLWLESEVIKGSPEVINKFKTSGKKIFYVTNNSTKTRDQFLDKFKKLGFNATKDRIRTCAISNSGSKFNVLDHSAIGTPARSVQLNAVSAACPS